MDVIKSSAVSSLTTESTKVSLSNEAIRKFLKTFVNVLIPLRISGQKIYQEICRNREYLEVLLKLSSLKATPELTTHLFLLLNYLSKSSSSTIYSSLRFHYANVKITKALLAVVDANAIKILADNNNKTTSGCSNEVINDRLKEIENLKAKLSTFSPSESISTTFCTKSFHRLKSHESTVNNTEYQKMLYPAGKRKSFIECRKNVASILRTGAIVTKQMKYNDDIIKKIIAGGNNPYRLKLNAESIIKIAHKKDIDEIDRRHLLGQIGCKEAKMAKIDAIKCKQEIVNELKKEKIRMRNLKNEEFKRSVSKSKVIIRKIHLNRLILKKMKSDVVFRKKMNADEVKKGRRIFQREIESIRKKEMERKIKLIREIRLLGEKKRLNGKLSSEFLKMSIDELRASIANIQQQINHERKNRQKKIHEEHNRHKQLIQNTETLIEIGRKLYRHDNQMKNEKGKWHSNKLVASNAPDLLKLREKLVQLRKFVANDLNAEVKY